MKNTIGMFAALMIALAMTGVAFAHWSETLYISGTVSTGEVDADFDSASSNDPPGTVDPGYDKNVGCTEVTGIGTKTLTVTVTNGYPCYSSRIDYAITNTGTIPVKIQSIEIEPTNFTLASASGSNDGEVYVEVTGIAVGDQIDPSQEKNGDLEIHIEQCAEEKATYTFTVTILLIQWNEYEYPPAPSRSVEVTISPGYQHGMPGATLNYTVTVKNTGTVGDIYDLENSDDQGWTLVLDDDSLTVPAGESRTTTLTVTIPGDATHCTEDTVTVTVTSQADPSVSDSASCIAHCEISGPQD